MHPRAFAVSLAFLLLGAAAPFGAAFAALVDELGEVTRLHHAGQSSAALERADKYLATKPRDAQMRFLKSVVLADTGRGDEAIAMLQQLAQDYPELPEPHNNLAAIHAARGDYAKARSELEESLRLSPGYATAQENLGDVYAALAGQAYARAQQLEPANGALPRKLDLIRQLTASAVAGAAGTPSNR
jgi:Flp pilus assembly protein TadD